VPAHEPRFERQAPVATAQPLRLAA
jgi:hypothetical protein